MASGGPDQVGQFVEVGWGLPWCSCQFQGVLGTETDGAREGSWSRCCEELSLLGH
jgi:hypothetical protein